MIKWDIIWLAPDNLYADRQDLFYFSETALSPWPSLQLFTLFTMCLTPNRYFVVWTIAHIDANTVQRIFLTAYYTL